MSATPQNDTSNATRHGPHLVCRARTHTAERFPNDARKNNARLERAIRACVFASTGEVCVSMLRCRYPECAFVSGCAYTELANGTSSPPPPTKKLSIEAIRGIFVFDYIPALNATAIEWITQRPSRSPSSWRRPVCILTPPQISRRPSLEVG